MRKTKVMKPVMLSMMVLFLLSVVPETTTYADEDAPPPYLYYYSGILNAFVIERADGTDSRILAQDVIPRHHNEIRRPIWSPSGQWLAWRSAEHRGPGPSWYSGWIISSDGSQRLTMLDHPPDAVVHVDVMEWASDDDLLFVSEIITDENRENATRRSMLIDAEAGIILASHVFETTFPDDSINFSWLPDEQGVVVLGQRFFRDEGLYLHLSTLLTDGTIRSETYSAEINLGLSPNGRLAYIAADRERLVVEHLFEGSTLVFTLLGRADSAQLPRQRDRLVWNSEQNMAMYYMQQAENYELRLLDFDAQDDLFLKPDVQLLTVRDLRYGNPTTSPGIWSPDSERFVFKTADGSHWLFELTDHSMTLLEEIPDYETIDWADNSQQLLLRNRAGITVYDLLSQQSTWVAQVIEPASEGTRFTHSFPSPAGGYVGLAASAILQIDAGIARTFSVHSAATYATSLVSHYDWHPDGSWVITTAYVTFAGCCGPAAYTVLRGDAVPNWFRRELTVRWGNSAGWLPQRAIAHLGTDQPESVLQQPAVTHRFDGIVSGVAWSPDGHDIVAVTNSGDVFIRNVTSTRETQPVFKTNTGCSIAGFYPPCPVYWQGDRIFIGNQAWDTAKEIAVPAENEDRVECSMYGCITALSDIVSGDGRWLAQVDSRSLVEVIDQQNGEIVETFEVEGYEIIVSVEWVNDKLVMLAAFDIIVFSSESHETLVLESVKSKGYADRFYTMQVSPDGRFVAGGSIVSEIHIWEIETGELVTVLNWYAKDLAFSPDGQWLAAANTDLVTIWDLAEFVEAR